MSTVLGISQTTPPPRWPRPWVDNIIETYNSHRPPRMRTTVSLPALPDPTKPGDNRFKPNRHVPVTESSRLGWVPTRKPDANLHALMLHRKYPKIGCHETRSAGAASPRARAPRNSHRRAQVPALADPERERQGRRLVQDVREERVQLPHGLPEALIKVLCLVVFLHVTYFCTSATILVRLMF